MYYIHIHITDTNITKDTNFTNLLEGSKGSRNQKIQALRLFLNRGLTTTSIHETIDGPQTQYKELLK